MLLEEKGWIAQEFYNEYLELKQEIWNLTHSFKNNESVQKQLYDKIERFRFVLSQLELHGVNLVDLLLLSLDVEL